MFCVLTMCFFLRFERQKGPINSMFPRIHSTKSGGSLATTREGAYAQKEKSRGDENSCGRDLAGVVEFYHKTEYVHRHHQIFAVGEAVDVARFLRAGQA